MPGMFELLSAICIGVGGAWDIYNDEGEGGVYLRWVDYVCIDMRMLESIAPARRIDVFFNWENEDSKRPNIRSETVDSTNLRARISQLSKSTFAKTPLIEAIRWVKINF